MYESGLILSQALKEVLNEVKRVVANLENEPGAVEPFLDAPVYVAFDYLCGPCSLFH